MGINWMKLWEFFNHKIEDDTFTEAMKKENFKSYVLLLQFEYICITMEDFLQL